MRKSLKAARANTRDAASAKPRGARRRAFASPTALSLAFLVLLTVGCRQAEPPPPERAPQTAPEAMPDERPKADVETAPRPETAPVEEYEANPLARYFRRLEADEFNPRMQDGAFAAQKPRRGGAIRVRSPSANGTLNPVLATTAPDREVINYLTESLVGRDYETLEFRPRLAWSWESRDLVVRKGADAPETGVIVSRDDDAIHFAPGATRRTFLKNDLAKYEIGPGGMARLGEAFGGETFRGHVVEYTYTVEIDTAGAPDAVVETLALDALATYEVELGGRTETRPAAKPFCYFRFFLRPGLKWSDGEPLDAHDWVFALDTIRNPHIREAGNLRNYYMDLESVRAGDDGLDLEFFWKNPYFQALEFSGGEALNPLPRHVFQPEQYAGDPVGFADAFTRHEFSRKPISCGPYQLASWASDRLELARNPLHFAQEANLPYFTREQPYLDRIVWVLIENRTVALNELQRGTIDFDPEIEPDTWVAAETNTESFKGRLVRAERTGLLYTYIGWNLDRPWFRDVRVRRALAMLVPAERIAEDIHFGLVRRVSQPFFIDGPVYDPSLEPIPYDPAGARRLLRQAGWLDRDNDGVLENEVEFEENGQMVRKTVDFEFEYLVHTARAYHEQIANIVKEEFGKVGIRVNVRPLDFATFIKVILDNNFDVCRLAWGTSIDVDPFQIWHSSQAVKGASNHVNFRNARVDEILETARETFDPARRWELYREMAAIIHEEQPMCFLFAFPLQYFYANRFRGVKLYPHSYSINLSEWWIAAQE